MIYREPFENLKPGEISYNKGGLMIRGQLFPSDNPRLAFVIALNEWQENNTFETMPNGTRIQLDTVIGSDVKYGSYCTIGGYGFGYEPTSEGKLIRMPHLSHVVIEDGVTIHSQVNIDRGVLSPTVIGAGTVIDSQVHVAHSAIIGKNCAIVAHAGIGGSCIIGDRVYIGFGAHIKNKVKIGNDIVIGMGAMVLRDVPDGWTVIGNPAKRLEK